ncbi:hypothetical protein GCM10009858_27290 [Terrabacter carboxydivorans]|uniref:Uncharacterized protein n=1 Tax=Terrabacter carboxydivorans TaxID=619730 RepID=A0ABN3LRQ6_9MICO
MGTCRHTPTVVHGTAYEATGTGANHPEPHGTRRGGQTVGLPAQHTTEVRPCPDSEPARAILPQPCVHEAVVRTGTE